MRNLELTQKTIDSERQVVKEELRLRVENNPIGKALDSELRLAYTTHPYRSQRRRRQEGARHGHRRPTARSSTTSTIGPTTRR